MWQFFVKCLIVCLLGYAVIAVVIYTATGQTWRPSIAWPDISWLKSDPQMGSLEAPDQPTYRWRENGRWHYGDKPPAGVKAERIDKQAKQ